MRYIRIMPALKNTLAYNHETRQVIKPVGMKEDFENAVEYDPVRDKGKLVCIHCKVALMSHRYTNDAVAAGNVFGYRGHFATIGSREPKKPRLAKDGTVIPYKPNVHVNCVAAVVEQKRTSTPDETKGYKIYIDMGKLKRVFRRNAEIISRDPVTRRIVNHDPDLVDRELVTLKTPRDFIKALKNLDPERLRKAAVVFENNKYTWDEFFVRILPRNTGKHDSRWVNVAKNVLQGKNLPVMAHIPLAGKEPVKILNPQDGDSLHYAFGSVQVENPAGEQSLTVQYWLSVHNVHMFGLVKDSPLQQFIGLAQPVGYYDQDDPNLYHIELPFDDPKRLVEADLRAITREVQQKAEPAAPSAPSIAA